MMTPDEVRKVEDLTRAAKTASEIKSSTAGEVVEAILKQVLSIMSVWNKEEA